MNATIIPTEQNHNASMGPLIETGGQGQVNHATLLETSEKGALKQFHPTSCKADTIQRIRTLIGFKLHRESSVFKTPTEQIRKSHGVGYFAPFAPGVPLNEAVDPKKLTFAQLITICVVIALLMVRLHRRELAHGDVRLANFHLNLVGNRPEVYAFDLDNFNHRDAPKPQAYGDLTYMAPEIHDLWLQKKPAYPDIPVDLFSLGVLFHELLLFKHPTTNFDDSPEKYSYALWDHPWVHDPYSGKAIASNKGFPSAVLNAQMALNIRRALGRDRLGRTTAQEWLDGFLASYNDLRACPRCNGPILNDPSKTVCPYEKIPFPDLYLVCPGGLRIPIDSADVRIGRTQLKSPHVSQLHAIFRKRGMDTSIEIHGRFGTDKLVGGVWRPQVKGKPMFIEKGDVFRLADVETRIE